jgi:hypothetical protein
MGEAVPARVVESSSKLEIPVERAAMSEAANVVAKAPSPIVTYRKRRIVSAGP